MNNLSEGKQKKGKFYRFLDAVERAGNKLPDPVMIFVVLCGAVIVLSLIGNKLGWSVKHPGTGDSVNVFSLFSPEGIQYMISNTYQNYSKFAPFAIAMPLFLAVGIVEKSGFLEASFIGLGTKVKGTMLTATIAFLGIMSNFLSDIGFVMLPPLAATLFLAVKRNPIVGMCLAYASVGCGLAANLLIGISDARMAATSQAAAQIIDPNITVLPTSNWYFIIVSCIVMTIVATFVTEKVLEPRLGKWDSKKSSHDISTVNLESYQYTEVQNKGMKAAGISLILLFVVLGIGTFPTGGFLNNAEGLSVFQVRETQLGAIVTTMIIAISLPGMVYGKVVGTISNSKDFGSSMAAGIRNVASFAVLCFFAGQFTGWFTKSNIGTIMAVSGAEFVQNIGLEGLPLMLVLIFFCAVLNLFIPSANAKWAILAPIFIPMFMLLGYAPALTQMAYRIGDSITNAITPMMAYFALMLGTVKTYDKDAGMGTLMSLLLPYTLFYALVWVGVFVIWFSLGMPLGPGGALYM